MQQYSHPASQGHLKILVSSLNKSHMDYMLIGAYALFAHGYYRATPGDSPKYALLNKWKFPESEK